MLKKYAGRRRRTAAVTADFDVDLLSEVHAFGRGKLLEKSVGRRKRCLSKTGTLERDLETACKIFPRFS